jgi:hypothetical protein
MEFRFLGDSIGIPPSVSQERRGRREHCLAAEYGLAWSSNGDDSDLEVQHSFLERGVPYEVSNVNWEPLKATIRDRDPEGIRWQLRAKRKEFKQQMNTALDESPR